MCNYFRFFFFFKQKTAYEMRISDWSSDVCSSDLSTPTGKYSGFHDNIPVAYYRGKLTSDSEGAYRVATTAPVPYQIPNQGYTGALLEAMGRHSWRPAHVHFKLRKPGFQTVTTPVYFEGCPRSASNRCSGMRAAPPRRPTPWDSA